jgi:hypothetical protein
MWQVPFAEEQDPNFNYKLIDIYELRQTTNSKLPIAFKRKFYMFSTAKSCFNFDAHDLS